MARLSRPCFSQVFLLHLHFVKIIGDLPDLLSECPVLEDLQLEACSGVADLNVPQQLDELRHLLISDMSIQMVDFHVTGLPNFCYEGDVVAIYLRDCSGRAKVTFTMIPGISTVKVLEVHADMLHGLLWDIQSRMLLGHTRKEEPPYTFMHLRHLTCQIKIPADTSNQHD